MFSSCLTHSKRTYPILHAMHIYCLLFIHIYMFLSLIHTRCTTNLTSEQPNSNSSTPYQPIPHASACLCLDSVPLAFFCKTHHLASLGLRSRRNTCFLFSLLLLLAGDVSLNPGPTPSSNLTVSCYNTRSVTTITHEIDKPAILQDFILDNNVDLCFLTETWLAPDSPSSILNQLTPDNYSIQHVSRTGKGGGVAVIFKSTLSVSLVTTKAFTTFEHMLLKLTSSSRSYFFLTVYRPPCSSKADFLSEFSLFLEDFASIASDFFILGDFNLHIDNPSDTYGSAFTTLLETFDLSQHISEPTHSSGHVLDLLITKSSSIVSDCVLTDPGLSDHLAFLCKLPVSISARPSRTVKTIRKFSSINIKDFSNDILASSLYSNPSSTLSKFTEQFHDILTSILDKHAPKKTIECRSTPNKPYYTPEIAEQKSERSRLETIYRNDKYKSKENEDNYKDQCKRVRRMITSAKRKYFRHTISTNQNCPKQLWKSLNALLGRNVPKSLPSAFSPSALATSFLNFFNGKISNLCATIPSTFDDIFHASDYSPTASTPILSNFAPATTDEILRIIKHSTDASCPLDIIPTKLLKSSLDVLVVPITHLINLSLSEGVFPDTFKQAIVSPLLKKHSLPKDDLSSYRPISNLNFISKVLEKVLHSRLLTHLESFPALSQFQSAYRKFHSTETALLRIHNDLLLAMNRQHVSALVLLDLSAAFDTIDHNILLNRLRSTFGISDTAFTLLSSYLCNRSQSVSIDNKFSSTLPLVRGVPQGSVLGPLLFSLYTTPLSTILSDSSIQFHFYADDTQLYVSFSSSDSSQSLTKLSTTLDLVHTWFCANRLAVNPSKTEYLLIGNNIQRSKVINASVYFQNLTLLPSDSVRNLGVIFDSNLDFKRHISSICRSSFYQIRQLRQIRSSLDRNSATILANSLVHSKLDYCNSLLYGLPDTSISRLQRVQNSLARVVCNVSKRSAHSITLLKTLHWLPISQRIKYKISLLTFKLLHSGKPSYLADCVSYYQPARTLRSTNSLLLAVPDIRSCVGRRSFSFASPTVWNALPLQLRSCPNISSFCKQLKTHYFPP